MQPFKNLLNSIKRENLIMKVKKNNLSYLPSSALRDLYNSIKYCERKKVEGIIIEAGCALGGSAIVIASAKSIERPFFVYDVFGMIPPPSPNDEEDVHERYKIIKSGNSTGLGGNTYYGYLNNLKDVVIDNFSKFNLKVSQNNIQLIEGLFQDTLKVENSIALAHIDGDWYDSVMTCLLNIEPKLSVNGILVIDDYYDWSGCKKAVDDYFKDKKNNFVFTKTSKLHIQKIR